MKFKTDFVTNSSSASFILNIETNLPDLETFQESWNNYIKSFVDENSWIIDGKIKKYKEHLIEWKKSCEEYKEKIDKNLATEQEKSFYNFFYKNVEDNENLSDDEIRVRILGDMTIKHLVGTTFQVEHWTTMYNYILDDVPRWMLHMIIMKNINPTSFNELGFLSCRLEIDEDN